MITCPIKELQIVFRKLQKMLLTIKPQKCYSQRNPPSQSLLQAIHFYVTTIFKEIVHQSQTNGEQKPNMYQQIEKDLQRQQNLNRTLIKKQLQFKQYQKCLEEELREERTTAKKLQSKIDKFNQKIVSKDMEIMHLSNEKKLKEKKCRDFITMDTLLNDKKIAQGLKAMTKQIITKPSHSRRRSDDICKRPSTGASKKRGSVSKR